MKFRSALVAAATVALVVPSGSALADTVVRKDQAGDVSKSVGDTTTPDPSRKNGDITRSVIKHQGSSVRVKIKHRDLVRSGNIITVVSVRSSKGKKAQRTFSIVAVPGGYAGKVLVENAKEKTVSCRTKHTISYRKNTTELVIPRSCLGNPKWVKVGIGVITATKDLETAYADDARTSGTVSGDDPVLSKRLYR